MPGGGKHIRRNGQRAINVEDRAAIVVDRGKNRLGTHDRIPNSAGTRFQDRDQPASRAGRGQRQS